jgi:release factor glutamine methyltransferase
MELNEVEVKFVNSDLFDQLPFQYDLIVCNPPYLTKEDMDSLQTEVSYEPRLALDGGADGLDFYRRIAREYRDHLNENGMLLLEIGSTQAESVAALFEADTSVLNDLGGNPRVLIVEPK